MSTVIVYVEHQDGTARRASLEALGAAHATGSDVVAVVDGPGGADVAPSLGASGAKHVVVLRGAERHSPDRLARDLAGVVKDRGARAFIASATSNGCDVTPRVAAHLDCTQFSDCVGFRADGDRFEVVRPWLAGKLVATLHSTGGVVCATLRRNVFAPAESGGTAEVIEADASTDFKAVLAEIAAKAADKLDVGDAPVVVSGGRGLKGPENFYLIEELAAAFGNAAVGASRAVVDAGWRPHAEQVGQTGKTVSPQLYVAVGISGAIQHLAGMKTSKVIVAINKDADAPIFKVADFGIVGDAFEVVPRLTEAVRTIRAEH